MKPNRRASGKSHGSKASAPAGSASFCKLVAEKLVRSTPSATAPSFARPVGKASIQPSLSHLRLDQRYSFHLRTVTEVGPPHRGFWPLYTNLSCNPRL